MSRLGYAWAKSPKLFSVESVSERFDSMLSFEGNKRDAKEFTELASPLSPLRIKGTVTAATSSSSSSSGSSGKRTHNAGDRKWDSGRERGHSKEHSSPRSLSGVGGSSSASSPVANVLPAGNICPSGKVGKMGMTSRSTARNDVLGSGTRNYGHGSILRGGPLGSVTVKAPSGRETESGRGKRADPEEATRAGNEHFKKGQFAEALKFYDRAVEMCPNNAACRNNRAAALSGLGRLEEAMKECEVAIQLDPAYGKAHHRLSGIYLRLGQVDYARKHLLLVGQQPDHTEVLKLQTVERHLGRCAEFRRLGDWKSALREADSVTAAGADSSLFINALRAEALLRLHHLVEADSTLSNAFKYEIGWSLSFHSKFLGMLSNSYVYFVWAQVEMALGRFENAVASVEKARQLDPRNVEISVMWNNVNSVVRARSQGNEFFNSAKFADASIAYSEGLKYDPSNPVLYCNRAACHSKLGHWEKSLEDCNEALRIQPRYVKALLRRAASYAKLEQWMEAVRDYEILRTELPTDTVVAEAYFHAEVALKASLGEEVSDIKFGGEVEMMTGQKQLQETIALTGISVVYFLSASNHHCAQTTPIVEALCARYPSLNFMKVEVTESPAIAKAENVRIVPTVKIYKNGVKVKEMICPSQQVLEFSLRHYGI
ncbi:hypothetical protein KFK09_008600 [Dendrobium nobile]|uniref:Thioredoxin domain-containing protein n=1 Tax=Dendrobium nobile TaxID=94219 RepID=A0A8T3BN63_DENNO|nr:hypothetical protein KFK09_008600 [Dendrobium nobile]